MTNGDCLTGGIIGAAIEVHKQLGPGLLESTYEECLAFELVERGLNIERQIELPVLYKGNQLNAGYRIDIQVNGEVIIEIKSVERLKSLHQAQLLTYLKLTGIRYGLLMNFNVSLMKNGIRRLINN
jgi:GxxExxY protein